MPEWGLRPKDESIPSWEVGRSNFRGSSVTRAVEARARDGREMTSYGGSELLRPGHMLPPAPLCLLLASSSHSLQQPLLTWHTVGAARADMKPHGAGEAEQPAGCSS